MQQLPTPSNTDSCSPSPQPPQTQSLTLTTAADLESFCWQFLDCMNTRDFACTALLPHFSTSFIASAPGQVPCNSVSELLHNRAAQCARFPEMELVFLSASTDIREGNDYAECQVFTEIRGMPPGVRRQVLNVFRWRRVREGRGRVWRLGEFTFLAKLPTEDGG